MHLGGVLKDSHQTARRSPFSGHRTMHCCEPSQSAFRRGALRPFAELYMLCVARELVREAMPSLS